MIARELFWEVINESVHTIAQSGVEACRKVMSCAADVSEEMITLVTADLSRYRLICLGWVCMRMAEGVCEC